MVFFSVWFNIPATRLCELHSVWMGTPNIQRSRIRKARRFIFFPVYESLFLQACIRITRVPLKSFVRKVMWQWLASVGVKRVDKPEKNNRILGTDINKNVSTEYAETVG